MQNGYDQDRWVGCQCNQINCSGIAWAVIISIFLLMTLNPDCVEKVAALFEAISDLLVLGTTSNCCSGIMRRSLLF